MKVNTFNKRNNMNTEIELLKLYNGEYIIGKFDSMSENDDRIGLGDPRLILFVPTRTGEMAAIVKPICFPFTSNRLKEFIEIYKNQIEYRLFDKLGEIEKDIIDGYNSEVAGIEIASTADMNAMTSKNTNAGGLII